MCDPPTSTTHHFLGLMADFHPLITNNCSTISCSDWDLSLRQIRFQCQCQCPFSQWSMLTISYSFWSDSRKSLRKTNTKHSPSTHASNQNFVLSPTPNFHSKELSNHFVPLLLPHTLIKSCHQNKVPPLTSPPHNPFQLLYFDFNIILHKLIFLPVKQTPSPFP